MRARLNKHELGQRLTQTDLAIWRDLAAHGKVMSGLWREAQRRLWKHPLCWIFWGF